MHGRHNLVSLKILCIESNCIYHSNTDEDLTIEFFIGVAVKWFAIIKCKMVNVLY